MLEMVSRVLPRHLNFVEVPIARKLRNGFGVFVVENVEMNQLRMISFSQNGDSEAMPVARVPLVIMLLLCRILNDHAVY